MCIVFSLLQLYFSIFMTIAKCIVLFHCIDCNTARTLRPKAGRKDDLINHVMLLQDYKMIISIEISVSL